MRVHCTPLSLQPLPGLPGRRLDFLKARLAHIRACADCAFEPYAPKIFLATTTASNRVFFQVIFKPFFFF
jgi:hypothetical protein